MQHDFILLDRSFSMTHQWGEAVASVNAYVNKLAEDKVDTGVTLAVFDTDSNGVLDFKIIRERIIPSTWKNVSPTEVVPRNGTPLNDATAKLVNLAESGGYDKVAIIIMTDGEENASKEYFGAEGLAKVKTMLDRVRAKGYQVLFLGANFDNQRQSRSFGGAVGQSLSATSDSLVRAMSATATMRSGYATGASTMNYTDDIRKAVGEDKIVSTKTGTKTS